MLFLKWVVLNLVAVPFMLIAYGIGFPLMAVGRVIDFILDALQHTDDILCGCAERLIRERMNKDKRG